MLKMTEIPFNLCKSSPGCVASRRDPTVMKMEVVWVGCTTWPHQSVLDQDTEPQFDSSECVNGWMWGTDCKAHWLLVGVDVVHTCSPFTHWWKLQLVKQVSPSPYGSHNEEKRVKTERKLGNTQGVCEGVMWQQDHPQWQWKPKHQYILWDEEHS